MADTPTLGVRAEFDDAEAQRRMKLYQERIKALEAVHNTLAGNVKKKEQEKEEAVEKSSKSQMNWLRKLRWEMVTLLFFVRIFTRAVREAWEAVSESAEISAERGGVRALAKSYEVDVGAVAQMLRDVSDAAISVQDSIQVALAGLLKDQGQFVNEYANLWEAARVAMVTTGAEAKDVFAALVEDLVEGTGAATDAVTPIFNLQLALHKYAEAAGTTVDALDPMVKAQVILDEVMETTNQLLEEGAEAALEEHNSIAVLEAGWKNLKSVWGETTRAGLIFSGTLESIQALLTTITQVIIVVNSAHAAYAATMRSFLQLGIAGITGGMGGQFKDPFAAGAEAYEKTLLRGIEAWGMFRDEVEEGTYTYERFIEGAKRDYDPLIDHLMKRQQILEQHEHQVEVLALRRDNRLEDLEIKHGQRLAAIERQRLREIAREYRQYERRVENETDRHNLKMIQDLEDHFRKMRQAREKYHLESLQNERLYQYERGLLVAYGDVLAIEDLDARYSLETQKRAENFQQGQMQEQETFDDNRRQKVEQFELELEILRRALDDQLEEIRIRTAERILEAEEQRQEELRKIQRDYEQQLEEEAYRHQRSLTEWNQYWAKLAERVEIGASEVTEILRSFFGVGGEADVIVTEFTDRWVARVDARARLIGILGPETTREAARTVRTYGQYAREAMERQVLARQFGGAGIVSSPTTLRLGEGHTPERFSVEPIAAGRSVLEVSWAGGVIPVHGTGGLAGMDLSSIGDAITQGLVFDLQQQLGNLRR